MSIEARVDGPNGVGDLTERARQWRARITPITDAMTTGLVERQREARLVLLAMLAGEHALLVGPPGTAKSLLSRRLRSVVADARYFERLLTRFSVPEELFGPLSLRGLESDEYRRMTRGYLPEAHVAFLDEVFKAGSAILNTLLSLLEERVFDNGSGRHSVELLSVVGASNELPTSDELGAFADRFLVRLTVGPVTSSAFPALLDPEPPSPSTEGALLARTDIDEVVRTSRHVGLPVAIVRALVRVREELLTRGVGVSDRRWRKVAKLLRTAAFLDGRTRVSLDDLTLLECCVGMPGVDEEAVRAAVDAAVTELLEREPARLEVLVGERERRAKKALMTEAHATDTEGRLLYVHEDGSQTTEPFREVPRRNHMGDHLYKAPPEADLAATDKREGYSLEELWAKFFRTRPNGLGKLEAFAANPLNKVSDKVARAKVMRPTTASPHERTIEHARVVELVEEVRSTHADLEEIRVRQVSSLPSPSLFRWRELSYQSDEKLRSCQSQLESLLGRLATIEALSEQDVSAS
jgi:MoxR-like ATPase